MTALVDVPGTVRTDFPVRRRRRPDWLRSPKVMIGLGLLGFFAIIALVGPYIAPFDPSGTGGDQLSGPSLAHWLGTTAVGEDVLSQLLAGTRMSLQVGFTAAVIAEVFAILVGITGAYLGGIGDEALSLGTNIFLVIPVLPLQILILTYLGATNWFMIALVIAVTAWPHSARKLRAQTLSIRSRDYVQAARVAGEPGWRIVLYEILPNEIAILATGFLFTVLAGVIVQTSLAFLGLGGTSQWSWGAMLHWSESENAFLLGAWWWYVPPGLCLALVGTGLALITLGIDEVVNPRLRGIKGARSAATKVHPSGSASSPRVTSAAADTVLTVRGLRVDYHSPAGDVHGVRNVTLSLRRGEVLGIAGESGSGKSTLAFAMTRLLRAPGEIMSGEVKYWPASHADKNREQFDVLAASPEQLRAFRWSEIAMVFQAAMNSLNPVLTIRTQLTDLFSAHRPGMSRTDRELRARELVRLVGIDPDRLDAYPHQLSGGQRQRAMIAMALALEPAIVILDEPTTSLDVVVQRSILRCIMDLRQRVDCSFVFITHDLSLLLEVANRIAVMYAGQIVELGDAEQIYRAPRHPYTQALLGSFPVLRGPRRTLTGIAGSPPDLRLEPSGCPFCSRCPKASERCSSHPPAFLERDDRQVACHIYEPSIQPISVTDNTFATARAGRTS
jgi:oligopeptide/dipeptide ABC transporter ATP-binding protein